MNSRQRFRRWFHVLAFALFVPQLAAANPSASRFQFIRHDVTDGDFARVRALAWEHLSRAEAYLGSAGDFQIRCHLYPTLEAKGMATGYTLPCHTVMARNELFVSLELGLEDDFPRELAGVVIRRQLGRARHDVLAVGLAIAMSPDTLRERYRTIAGRLAGIPGEADLATLLDNREFARASCLAVRAEAFALVAHLMAQWGKDAFLQRYANWSPSHDEVAAMQPAWHAFLDRLAGSVAPPRRQRSIVEFQRGFCHAHEGYRVHNGYISRASDEALEHLASLHANAVSLTPFTFMRSAHAPSPLPYSDGPGAENDESVIHAARTAQALGMTVMLKPHVWLNASWPGEVEMASDAEWDLFFDYYYQWIRHYAILADYYDIAMLCVGVELSQATMKHEDRWIELVSRLRRLYGGKIVYAANWGEEAEALRFWRAFDYIGVNCYYPLSSDKDATDEELRAGANDALDRLQAIAQRYDVPLIITEVGYNSAPSPWVQPHEWQRGAQVDTAAQARCYRAFFSALQSRDGIVGVYWWKWPTYLEYGGASHAGFTPAGKEAEAVVKEWFSRLAAE